jgi:putative aldouronate transport system permease protein
MYVATAIWQGIGYSSIIYLAAITGINPELYESAVIDGASRPRLAVSITIPSILPTIVVLFILKMGGMFNVGMEKVLLMQSPLTYITSDVIETYVYREGILGGSYSYTSAVGFFSSLVSLFFLLLTNYLSKKVNETSLF